MLKINNKLYKQTVTATPTATSGNKSLNEQKYG